MRQVTGWRCRVCGAEVGLDAAEPWRCPRSSPGDRHHLLRAVLDPSARPAPVAEALEREPNPLLAFDERLAWAASAAARGLDERERRALVLELDGAVRRVAGTGFAVPPLVRSGPLSDELGFSPDGGVWVKDETGAVGGSQKARHLVTVLLQLLATGRLDPSPGEPRRLAIASCGNAALAAATLAAAAGRAIDVFVPTWMSDGFGERLDELGATIHRCERRDADPPGDPAMLRFREAVADGAVPFTVQGPESAPCLDGGRTLGWELAAGAPQPGFDRVLVQVGGGAFATCVGDGLAEAGSAARLDVVQTEGCAPLARALRRAEAVEHPERRWGELMTPWDSPSSVADGILDDETYDWLGVLDALRATGGGSVVAPEADVRRAHDLALAAELDVSPTGSAGLAGLLALGGARPGGRVEPHHRVAVVASGVAR